MALTTAQVTLLGIIINKATDVAISYFNKQAEQLTEEELNALIDDEEALTSSLVDEFNAL